MVKHHFYILPYISGCVTYEAVYDFHGELETHLSLHQGDVVNVHRKEDNGWWRGTAGDRTGWFPNSYVQAVLHGNIYILYAFTEKKLQNFWAVTEV